MYNVDFKGNKKGSQDNNQTKKKLHRECAYSSISKYLILPKYPTLYPYIECEY